MNSETNLKPTAVDKISISLSTIMEQMQEMGLSERDLIMLLQDRAKGNINRTDIKNILDAIRVIEKQFLKVQEKS